jgi:hypothetical protein
VPVRAVKVVGLHLGRCGRKKGHPTLIGERSGNLRLATSRRAFEQHRLLQLGSQEDNPGHHRIDEVAGGFQLGREFVERFKHRDPSLSR